MKLTTFKSGRKTLRRKITTNTTYTILEEKKNTTNYQKKAKKKMPNKIGKKKRLAKRNMPK